MDGLDIIVEVMPVFRDMVMVWVTLLILFKLLEKLAYGPITKFIEDRKSKIESDIDEAKTLNAEAQETKEKYEAKMAEAREESQRILSDARARGEELKNEILSEARGEADVIKTRARKEIEREKAAAFESVKSETGDMALLIASRIMEQEMDVENQEGLVDKFINEVGSTPWQN